MAEKEIMIETYGIDPPQKSTLYWGKESPTEDNIIDLIDFQASLQKLTTTEREILSLSTQGYSEREISSMIDINNITVHRIKGKAINRLRGMMNGEDNLYGVLA